LQHTATQSSDSRQQCSQKMPKKLDASPPNFGGDASSFLGIAPDRCQSLRHNAPHCNTIQHTATPCNTLYRQQIKNTLQYSATHYKPHCNTLQHTTNHTAAHCNTEGQRITSKFRAGKVLYYTSLLDLKIFERDLKCM